MFVKIHLTMKGKVVIITGASSGIGMACAKAFANRGANIVIAARTLSALEELASELGKINASVLPVKCDVSVEEDCKRLINEAVLRFGRIDILVNNAGISMRAIFKELNLDVLKRLMDVNFWGSVYCTKYALPFLLEYKGSVVGVSSIAGFKGLPARTGYSASKFALYGFLDALRVENLKTGLHVMVIAPGFTASNIRKVALAADGSRQGETPRDESKMMTAEKVADILVKGIIKRRRNIILTTEGKAVMFLKSLFPRLLDKLEYSFMAKEPDSPFK